MSSRSNDYFNYLINLVLKYVPFDHILSFEKLIRSFQLVESRNEILTGQELVSFIEENYLESFVHRKIQELRDAKVLMNSDEAFEFLKSHPETEPAAAYFKSNISLFDAAHIQVDPETNKILRDNLTISEVLFFVKDQLPAETVNNYPYEIQRLKAELYQYMQLDVTSETHSGLTEVLLTIDPGSATPEFVADFFAELSLLYRYMGGSGLNFTLDGVNSINMQYHEF